MNTQFHNLLKYCHVIGSFVPRDIEKKFPFYTERTMESVLLYAQPCNSTLLHPRLCNSTHQ